MSKHDYYSKILHGQPSADLDRDTHVDKIESDILIRFNQTYVIRIKPDGTIVLNCSGWRTPSVKARMNLLLKDTGWWIVQEDNVWYLQNDGKIRYLVTDGLQIKPDGSVDGAISGERSKFKMNSIINRYVSDFLKAWKKGWVRPPGPQDPGHLYKICADVREKKCIPSEEIPELRHYVHEYMISNYHFGSMLMAAIELAGGADQAPLTVLEKFNIQEWLAEGEPVQSKLIQTKNIGKILRSFLRKLFDLKDH